MGGTSLTVHIFSLLNKQLTRNRLKKDFKYTKNLDLNDSNSLKIKRSSSSIFLRGALVEKYFQGK